MSKLGTVGFVGLVLIGQFHTFTMMLSFAGAALFLSAAQVTAFVPSTRVRRN
jgi:hypothetical protein